MKNYENPPLDIEPACGPPGLGVAVSAKPIVWETEKQVKMAAQLYEIRDTAKRLLGEKYKPKMAELGAALKKIARDSKKSELEAATELCKAIGAEGMDTLMIMAAAVELIEPSNVKVRRLPPTEGNKE